MLLFMITFCPNITLATFRDAQMPHCQHVELPKCLMYKFHRAKMPHCRNVEFPTLSIAQMSFVDLSRCLNVTAFLRNAPSHFEDRGEMENYAVISNRCPCYKTFFVRSLQMFVIIYSVFLSILI
jgi:hypothetical protein